MSTASAIPQGPVETPPLIAQVALILWIFISIAMFATLTPLRAFLLTYVIGYLVLPVEVANASGFTGTIYITQSLRLDKLTSCNLGALLGTAFFATHLVARFRFLWVDLAVLVVTVGVFLTSLVNGLGAKDGVSQGIELFRQFLPLMVLARIHLTTASELYEAMRTIIAGAFVYAFLAIAEWRLSPFIHDLVYGYFQHSFDQFMRYSHFRPVGFLRHAIELSFFLGTSAAMAGWLWHRKLLTPLWGIIPPWGVVLTITAGLAATMTYSGYAAFLVTAGLLVLLVLVRSRWILLILPLVAIIWMAGRYTNQIDASLLLRTASLFDANRSNSLEYRLESERIHLADASQSLFLGKGGMNGIVREDYGGIVLAVDAWWLIQITFFGLVGVVGWYCVWGSGIVDSVRRWHDLTPDLQTLAAVTAIMLGAQFVDFLFNSFPSPFLFILDMGLLSTLRLYQGVPQPGLLPEEFPIDELQMIPATGQAGGIGWQGGMP
jgi:hypothetical protein